MNYLEARNPKYANYEHTEINLFVFFEGMSDYMPFTASENDTEPHGRELFNKAVRGDFGEIAAYDGPTREEYKAVDLRRKRDALLRQLDIIVSNPLRWNDFSQGDKDALSAYRQSLLDVPQQPDFPDEVEWPLLSAALS